MLARVERREIAKLRLRNQRLSWPGVATPENVVRWLGAMQSQEYAVAKWSIGQRARRTSDAALERAFAAGTFLRTHVLRPTWHFVLPADIRWMIELTGPRVLAMTASYYRKFGLDDDVMRRSRRVMVRALAGNAHLTRRELGTLLDRDGIHADALRLGFILMRAELDCVISSGAPKGKQHTYALFEERAPQAASWSRDQALAELTKRYFTSRGPATLKDYMWWSSLTAADAKRGVQMVEPPLARADVAERTYWFAASRSRPTGASPAAHLLQGYDEYVIAYSESRDVAVRDEAATGVVRVEAPFYHAIVLNGSVVGHWRRVLTTTAMTIEIQLRRSLNRAEGTALAAAVDRYGEFMGVPTAIQIVR
jgi:hypothetical protein